MPDQVAARADRLIAPLRTLEGNIALISHGEFSPALVARWIGLPLVNAQHFLLGTASLGILGYNPAHPEVPVIALRNVAPGLLTRNVRHQPDK
jgi:probable phosphoglycerate mutase